ncbi:MAG: 3'-5' exonuclease [Xanthomonadales bacterium]|nr:3'-5' exonuclease [Gammaproteobacteria bacterium]MBT8053214.1 3'-5' exonuclease [Gammaproteobacteria bacterium]NND57190.1 3'-5' exonuclease [Xanthomonadales bacterium]NNK50254.1 3'-5' exonuclease [Xanthomonadales bacterium]
MLQRWKHGRRCHGLARRCSLPVLAEYLDACGSLKIDDIENTPLIAVDLELTGLDKEQDQIIAIGWTQIDDGRIRLGSNRYLVINADKSVGSSAAIHELMDHEVAQGEDLEVGLGELFEAARDRLWILHHAGLDIGFIKKACESWAGIIPGFIVLDTLRIEYRLRKRREIPVKQGDLQLGQIREVYGLPGYTAHNALTDALATAELMLAIASRLDSDSPLKLKPHLKFF